MAIWDEGQLRDQRKLSRRFLALTHVVATDLPAENSVVGNASHLDSGCGWEDNGRMFEVDSMGR
jgi:hypothetical protein